MPRPATLKTAVKAHFATLLGPTAPPTGGADAPDKLETLLAQLEVLPPFWPLALTPARYKVAYGGRGGGKSENLARIFLALALCRKVTILNLRMVQKSVSDSVYRLYTQVIARYQLEGAFVVTRESLTARATGAVLLFKGLSGAQAQSLKSLAHVDFCWLEEAQMLDEASLDLLIPTIRAAHSELWFSLNPLYEDDVVYRRLINATPYGLKVVRLAISYRENSACPEVLRAEARACRKANLPLYKHIWLGYPATIFAENRPFLALRVMAISHWPRRGVSAFLDPAFGGRDAVGLSILYRAVDADGIVRFYNHAAQYQFNIKDELAFLLAKLEAFNVERLFIEATGNSGLLAVLVAEELRRRHKQGLKSSLKRSGIFNVNATENKVLRILANLKPVMNQLVLDSNGEVDAIRNYQPGPTSGEGGRGIGAATGGATSGLRTGAVNCGPPSGGPASGGGASSNDHAIDALASHIKVLASRSPDSARRLAG